MILADLPVVEKFTCNGDAVDYLLQIFAVAAAHNCRKLVIEPKGAAARIRLFRSESDTKNPCDELSVSAEVGRAIHLTVNDRCYAWPESPESYSQNPTNVKRFLAAPLAEQRYQFDLILEQSKVKPKGQLLLHHFRHEGVMPIAEALQAETYISEQLRWLSFSHAGILLTPARREDLQVDATAVALAAAPKSSLYFEHEKIIPRIISESEKRLIILPDGQGDAIDLMLHWVMKLSDNLDLRQKFIDRLIGAFIHERLPKICANCSRLTKLPSPHTRPLPVWASNFVSASHYQGAGCAVCNGTGLRGTCGISSIAPVNTEMRSLLSKRATYDSLVGPAYRNGMRTLLEDGLAQVRLGHTTIFAVQQAVLDPSPVLESLILHRFSGENSASPSNERQAVHYGHKLLLVEDDFDQLEIFSALFKAEGFEVIMASSGADALALLERSSPDLIVTDLQMPGMNGADLTRAIRARGEWQHLPVLVLTVHGDPILDQIDRNFGADAFCSKTIASGALIQKVRALLAKRS